MAAWQAQQDRPWLTAETGEALMLSRMRVRGEAFSAEVRGKKKGLAGKAPQALEFIGVTNEI